MSNFSNLNSGYNTLAIVKDGVKYTVPGIVTVNFSISRTMDKQKSNGQDGEVVIDQGSTATEFDVSIQMNGYEHQTFVNTILPVLGLKGQKGQEKNPLTVINQQINYVCGISKVLVASGSFPSPQSGVATVSIKLIEWTKPKKQKAATGNWGPLAPDPGLSSENPLTNESFGDGQSEDALNNELAQQSRYKNNTAESPYYINPFDSNQTNLNPFG